MHNGRLWRLHSKLLARTPIINVFMFSVVGYYTIGTTTLKDKFSVVGHRNGTATRIVVSILGLLYSKS